MTVCNIRLCFAYYIKKFCSTGRYNYEGKERQHQHEAYAQKADEKASGQEMGQALSAGQRPRSSVEGPRSYRHQWQLRISLLCGNARMRVV